MPLIINKNKNQLSNDLVNTGKKSYLHNLTQEDIEKEKTMKRFDMLMNKLEEITEQKNLASNSKKKVLPKIVNSNEIKESQAQTSKDAAADHEKSTNLNSNGHKSSDEEDSDDEDPPENPIKAPNELLEEVGRFFLEFIFNSSRQLNIAKF